MPQTPNFNHLAYGPSQNPFAPGQCTWFAFGRALEVTGTIITFSQSYGRHGRNWLSLVTGLATGTTPRANSVAAWAGDKTNPYGHVAFVDEMVGDICRIRETNIRSFNKDLKKHCEEASETFSYSTTAMKSRGKGIGSLLGYIYFNPLPAIDFWRKRDPLKVSPTASIANPNFDAQFKISNVGSRIVTVETACIGIHTAAGQFLFDLVPKDRPITNQMIPPGTTVPTGLCVGYFRSSGDFVAHAKVRIDKQWHTLSSLPFKVGSAR